MSGICRCGGFRFLYVTSDVPWLNGCFCIGYNDVNIFAEFCLFLRKMVE